MNDFESRRDALLKLKARKGRKVELLKQMQTLDRSSAQFNQLRAESLAIDRECALLSQKLGRESSAGNSSSPGTSPGGPLPASTPAYQALPGHAGGSRVESPNSPIRSYAALPPARRDGAKLPPLSRQPPAQAQVRPARPQGRPPINVRPQAGPPPINGQPSRLLNPSPSGASLPGPVGRSGVGSDSGSAGSKEAEVLRLKQAIAAASAREQFEQCVKLRDELRRIDPSAISPPPVRRKRSMSAGSLPLPAGRRGGLPGAGRRPIESSGAGPQFQSNGAPKLGSTNVSTSQTDSDPPTKLTRSLSDRRPGDIKLGPAQLREKVVNEIVETERSYVRDLEYVVETYFVGLSAHSPALFGNWTDLLALNTTLLQRLREPECVIGQVFFEMADYLKIYRDYVRNQRPASDLLVKLTDRDTDVRKFLELAQRRPEAKGLNLDSYLVKPLQRITKYPLLLRELLKYTDNQHPEHEVTSKAVERMQGVVSMVNDTIEREADGLVLKHLSELPGAEDIDIVLPSRRLVCQHPCLWRNVTDGDKKGKPGNVFLFNDAVLVTKSKSSKNIRIRTFLLFEHALLRPSLDTIFYEVPGHKQLELEMVSVADRMTSALCIEEQVIQTSFLNDCNEQVLQFWRKMFDKQAALEAPSSESFEDWIAKQRSTMLRKLAAVSSPDGASEKSPFSDSNNNSSSGDPRTLLTSSAGSPPTGRRKSVSGDVTSPRNAARFTAGPVVHGPDRNHTTGWLKKKGQYRWFLLDNQDGKLYWYKNEPNMNVSFVSRKSSQNSLHLLHYGPPEAVDCEIRLTAPTSPSDPAVAAVSNGSTTDNRGAAKTYVILADCAEHAELWAQQCRRARLSALDTLKRTNQHISGTFQSQQQSDRVIAKPLSKQRPMSVPLSSDTTVDSDSGSSAAVPTSPSKRKLFGLLRSPRSANKAAGNAIEPAISPDVEDNFCLPSFCHKCGNRTAGEKKFCAKCASPCGHVFSVGVRNPQSCPKCKVSAIFGGIVCGNCGQKL